MLDSLDDLVERSALAGLSVRVSVVGEVTPLPAAVELAAFRIVQEAVTNVIVHGYDGASGPVEVEVGGDSETLEVRIADRAVLLGSETDQPEDFQTQAFGLARMWGEWELGYTSLPEILRAGAEIDLHFAPTTPAVIKAQRP